MKKLFGLLVVAAVVAALAGTAIAEDKDKVVYKQKTIIDFSDVTIQGELTKPEGSYISTRKGAEFTKLIKVRENFDPELNKSVDKL
jgi:hypothetical protein